MPKAKKKLKVDEGLMRSCLPDAPSGFTHSVQQLTARSWAIWLHHPDKYLFSSEPRKTIWGFIKGDMVHAPKNFKMARKETVCHILDMSDLSGYTSIIPTKTIITD